MWLFGPRIILVWLESSHTSLNSTAQVEGCSLQVLTLTSARGSALPALQESSSAPVFAKVVRTLERKRLCKYRVLLLITFCLSGKKLLSYKSSVLVGSEVLTADPLN